MRRLVFWVGLLGLLGLATPAVAQPTIQHLGKVQIKPSGTTTYTDTVRVWGGLQAGAGGAVQVINQDGSLNINATTVPAGTITFSMWDDNGCSSGQIPKYNGSAWVCDTDITATGSGTLGSISLVMPSGTFDISPGTLTADGTFTVTFDTQSANQFLAGPTSGAAATPTWRSLDVLDLPTAVVTSSDNEVITGTWRFSVPTIFGDSVTPQQLIHIYKGSAQAGLSIEKGDETERWDILANTHGLQILEATGGLAPLTFKSNRIGVFTNAPTAGYEMDINGDLKISGNLSLGSYFENSIIPSVGDTYNLGDLTRPWAQAWISQINATVFAEATATIFGGYSIIGRNAGATTAVIASGDTTIYLDKDGTSLPVSGNTWILIKSYDMSGSTTPKTEYIRLISVGTCSGSGAALSCPWSVERDATGLHGTDPAWNIGTPFMFLGSNGDGRIEFYSVSGLPRMSILRQGTTAASATDIVRLGGLDGVAGMSGLTGRYGIFIGEGTTNYMKFQKNVGGGASDPADDVLEVQGTIKALAGKFGSHATNFVNVDTTGLDVGTGVIHGGKTTASDTTDGFWFGKSGGTGAYIGYIGTGTEYVKWDGADLSWAGNNTSLTAAGVFTASNAVITGNITAITGAIGGWLVTTDNIKDTAGLVGLSRAVTGSDDVRFWAGNVTPTSAPFRVTEAGVLTATSGTIGGWTLSSTRLASGASAAISGGKTSYPNSTVDGFWLGWDSISSAYTFRLEGSGNSFDWNGSDLTIIGGTITGPTITGGTLTAGGGAITLDAAGLTWKNSSSEVIGQIDDTGIILGNQSAATFSGYGTEDGYKFYMVDDSANQSGVFGMYRSSGGTNKTVALRSVWQGGTSGVIGTGKAVALLYAEGATWTGSRTALPAFIEVTGETAGFSKMVFSLPVSGNVMVLDEDALYVDTNVLYVDTVLDRVGINDSTPSRALEVVGDGQLTTGNLYISNTAGSAGTSTSGIWLGGTGVAHTNIAWQANENLIVFRTGNSPTQTTDSYGAVNLDTNGYVDAAGGFKVNGTAGISFTANPTTCTSITVTNGIITAKAGC